MCKVNRTMLSNDVVHWYSVCNEMRLVLTHLKYEENKEDLRPLYQNRIDILLEAVNDLMHTAPKEKQCNRVAVAVEWRPFKGLCVIDNQYDVIDLEEFMVKGVKLHK